MTIEPSQANHVARVFAFLAAAERVARDCARSQRRLTDHPGVRRFFGRQASQEAVHAAIFDRVASCLSPTGRRVTSAGMARAVERYRHRLEVDTEQGDLSATVIGQQVVFEGMGEVILRRIDVGIEERRLGFGPLRRMILRQERAHHGFGHRWLDGLVRRNPDCLDGLRRTTASYLALMEDVLVRVDDLFEPFDEDPAAYRAELVSELPAYLRSRHSGNQYQRSDRDGSKTG